MFSLRFRAVLFDCVGTLFRVEVDYELQLKLLHGKLVEAGFTSPYKDFLKAYGKAYAKYLKVRVEELREVTNSFWTAEALQMLGYEADPSDPEIERAVEAYFEPYIEAVKPVASELLKLAKGGRDGWTWLVTFTDLMDIIEDRVRGESGSLDRLPKVAELIAGCLI